ncbi:MAG: terminase family protein [Tateyamaria sp.]|uniref:terminase large subunit domain-containing protein n=1 Tax=Tateyamaria sp. TaxID=1929288 RepID=UPI0032A11D1C
MGKRFAEAQAAFDRLEAYIAASAKAEDLPDPVKWAEQVLGFALDPWQQNIMRSQHHRLVVVAARQSGKSVITGAKDAYDAMRIPGLRVVVVSPSFRQSALLAAKIDDALAGSGQAVKRVRERMTLPNGSTVQVLHGDRASTLRGYTADLLLADELAFAKPELAPAILPMVGASKGRLIAISSPNGPGGIVYDMAHQDGVEFMQVPARAVGHFDSAVIAEIRGRLGAQLARQELDAEFVASASSVFDADALDRMFAPSELPEDATDVDAQETGLQERFRRQQNREQTLNYWQGM